MEWEFLRTAQAVVVKAGRRSRSIVPPGLFVRVFRARHSTPLRAGLITAAAPRLRGGRASLWHNIAHGGGALISALSPSGFRDISTENSQEDGRGASPDEGIAEARQGPRLDAAIRCWSISFRYAAAIWPARIATNSTIFRSRCRPRKCSGASTGWARWALRRSRSAAASRCCIPISTTSSRASARTA